MPQPRPAAKIRKTNPPSTLARAAGRNGSVSGDRPGLRFEAEGSANRMLNMLNAACTPPPSA